MEYTFYHIALLALGGFLTGIINVIGGGGSLVSLPILMGLGLSPAAANGTNRIAIILGDIAGIKSLSSKTGIGNKSIITISIPVVLGAIVGAITSALIFTGKNSEMIMNILLLAIIIYTAIELFKIPKDNATQEPTSTKLSIKKIITLGVIGFYGGFIQAGFTYLAMLVLIFQFGMDMVNADKLKLILNFAITPLSLLVFIIADQVFWISGIILGIGGILGSYAGAKMVIKVKPKIILMILMSILVITSLYIILFRITNINHHF